MIRHKTPVLRSRRLKLCIAVLMGGERKPTVAEVKPYRGLGRTAGSSVSGRWTLSPHGV